MGGLHGRLTLDDRLGWAFEAIDRATNDLRVLGNGEPGRLPKTRGERIQHDLRRCREILIELRGAVEAYRECAMNARAVAPSPESAPVPEPA
jgi:hypothetical protein